MDSVCCLALIMSSLSSGFWQLLVPCSLLCFKIRGAATSLAVLRRFKEAATLTMAA